MNEFDLVSYLYHHPLSYDHRIVDGAMGGGFLRKIADYLEAFALNTEI